MIIKVRQVPDMVIKTETLLRRLSNNHPKRSIIEAELSKRLAGYKGEQSIEYYLNQLPHKDYFIFHDVRLFIEGYYFQVDSLILSPYFALILEIKNISGTLYFEGNYSQLIRTYNNKEQGFPDPILQSERQRFQFMSWLQLNGYPSIPVENLVVVSNPSSIIKSSPEYPTSIERVCHAAKLLTKINEYKNIYTKKLINLHNLNQLKEAIVHNHTVLNINVLEKYKIHEDELVKGVYCPGCKHNLMERVKRTWFCSKCCLYSKDAHIKAVEDYFMLFNGTFTNSQFRKFINLNSRHIASRLLATMNLPTTGSTKGTVYHQPPASK
ncbi:nuclease-related domain-containing protein [Peribacillus deserti]|uniref:Nuclease n=1 Tax=Peribacillus deserti TaxID=673318 RepID=A0A2N5M106_9BACI|nr:nuclease-related domain-containing protein [Peribacillus deserti]PLT28039.1 nuclease [Peribacillus deserti]